MKLGLVLVVTCLVYASVRVADFTYEDWNDTGSQVVWEAPYPLMATWRPVPRLLTTWTLRAQGGQSAGAYHLGNLAVHLMNGALIYAVALPFGELAALTVAVLWLLHPLQSEAVAHVTSRTDLLMATAILLMLLAVRVPGWLGISLVLACCLLAVLAKETGAVAVGLLPLWCWWQRLSGRRFWPVYAIAGSVGVYAAWHLLPISTYSLQPAHGPFWFAAVQAAAVWRLLALAIWPFGFTVDHDFDVIGPGLALVALSVGVAVVVMAWRARARWPALTFGVLWVVLSLGPRFVVSQGEYLNEHQMYAPMVGAWMALARAFSGAEV